jgi:hypothetical protein
MRIGERMFDGDRLALGSGLSDQPLSHLQRHLTHRVRVEPDRRRERQMLSGRVDGIDRTDIRIEALGDQFGHVGERLLEIVRARHDLCNIRQQ